MTWRWTQLFSEGGPFVVAEEAVFRTWPGAAGWQDAIGEIEAPGGLWAGAGGTLCFFDPEDPGPVQVATS